ncbi:MAG: endonuclease VIII [Pseudomonadota bacterium]
MPEGPEIRRAADKVERVLLGRVVRDVEFGLSELQSYAAQLSGHTVTAVETRGKALLTRFDNGLTIYSHNQLYGRWYTTRRPRMPKTNRQLRIFLQTDTHRALLYSASDIAVLDEKGLQSHPFLARIGPDILNRQLTQTKIVERLNDKRFSGRSLGSLYLDQSFLAGNGNYLRSEILWAAGIEPSRKPKSLSTEEQVALAHHTLRIAWRSYRTGGITVVPSLAADLKAKGLTRSKYRFYVFGRDGEACHRCQTRIQRRTMGSRNLFTCPSCQREPLPCS